MPWRRTRGSAAAIADPVERRNVVTSELAAQIHYLGDWRTLQERFVPRELAVIAETQDGRKYHRPG